LEIDGQALRQNFNLLRRCLLPTTQLLAVVKANGYGHGAVATAWLLQQAGAARFGVATLSEALELRQAGIQQAILVMGYTPAWLAASVVQAGITATVYELETAVALATAAQAQQTQAVVHVKVNTGMNRLGLRPEAVGDFLHALQRLPGLRVEGIFTHFADADQADLSFAQLQLARFRALLTVLASAGLRPPLAHAANSAATLSLPAAHLDLVRCGIALYGLAPDPAQRPLPAAFQPVLSWKARVAQVLTLAPGDSVSYGRTFVATQRMVAAVIPVGYADGFPRAPAHWGTVLIHGQPAPLLGRVCMDQSIVDVTAIMGQAAQRGGAPVRQGDEVVLIGRQGAAALTAETVAARQGTINYEVVSRIMARVPRVLVGGAAPSAVSE